MSRVRVSLGVLSLLGLSIVVAGGCPGFGLPGGPAPDVVGGSAWLSAHTYSYDAGRHEFVLGGKRIAASDVQRDLSGSLCGTCHYEQVQDFMNSVHQKWASTNARVLYPGGGAHGMIDRACGLPASTSLINYTSDVQIDECGKCHANRYMPIMQPFFEQSFQAAGFPNAAEQAESIMKSGVDCLICHSAQYRSVPKNSTNLQVAAYAPADAHSPTAGGDARCAHDNTDFNGDGQPDPMIDSDGDGVADMPLMQDRDGDGTPETPWPTIAQDRSAAAVLSVGATSDETCLRCHEHARTGYKRGTLFRPGHDIHSSSEAVAVSSTATGASFTFSTVTETVAVAVPPLPSETV